METCRCVDDKWENHTNVENKEKAKAASTYRPITYLSLVWKSLTVVIMDEMDF